MEIFHFAGCLFSLKLIGVDFLGSSYDLLIKTVMASHLTTKSTKTLFKYLSIW